MTRSFLLAALGAGVVAAALAAPAQEPTVRWRSDWESARREAREASKPLFVVFRCER